jgi:molybdopterin synthase sulfur carrier subunit
MATVTFTPFIQHHTPCPPQDADGNTVREVLEAYFETHRRARGYILDDQGGLRPRLVLYVDGVPVTDRVGLSDPVHARAHVFVQHLPLDTEYESM